MYTKYELGNCTEYRKNPMTINTYFDIIGHRFIVSES